MPSEINVMASGLQHSARTSLDGTTDAGSSDITETKEPRIYEDDIRHADFSLDSTPRNGSEVGAQDTHKAANGSSIHHAHLQHVKAKLGRPFRSIWPSTGRGVQENPHPTDLERLEKNQVDVECQPSSPELAEKPDPSAPQGVPRELRNLTSEILLVIVCSASLTLYAFALGDVTVNQEEFRKALGMQNTELPWLTGSFNTANGLSVVVSGSLMDLAPPRRIMLGAFGWFTIWNIIGAFSIRLSTAILFHIVRAMQGLAVGVMVSGSMSILGRVYKPGLRKNRVFSAMAGTAPFGFWLGGVQGGALRAHLPWIFGSNAMISGLCCVTAYYTVPPLQPVADIAGTEAPSLKQFDYLGATVAMGGFICLLFGLTQGSVTSWAPYTYALVIVGVLLLAAFIIIERYVERPIIPNRLWKTKGFKPLMLAYFLGYGSYSGAWQFYAVQFWLRIQHHNALTVALYLLPNGIVGVLATWIVSRTLHLVPGHYIYAVSMLAYALGPAFFLPQTPNTTYWALSMPGVALVTFGPDLAFAAASIFITSNVARSYQGSAGSMLMMMQNLSAAIMTAVADAVGARVDRGPDGDIGLKGLRAIWWLGLAGSLVSVLITVIWVRIPKEEEKDHVV